MATKKGQDAARSASPTRPVSEEIHKRIAEKFGEAVELVDAVDPYTVVREAAKFSEVMAFLRNDPGMAFDLLRSVSAVDYPEEESIASVYHLYSYEKGHAHVVKLYCDRLSPEAPTVEHLWPVANWFEREAYDLTGIVYRGHSDLRRILLPEDWQGFPLRKDYVEQPSYHGIGTTRPSPLDAYAAMDEARRKAREERGEPEPPTQKSRVTGPDKAGGDTSEGEASE